MAQYEIKFDNRAQLVDVGTVIKYGQGKRAVPVLGIRAYEAMSGKAYAIDHIPTGSLIADRFEYQSAAKAIAQTILEQLGEIILQDALTIRSLCPEPLLHYISYYQFHSTKKPEEYDEWRASPEYEQYRLEASNRAVLEQQEAEHTKELCEGDFSLAWFHSPDGDITADELRAITEGRPFDR